MAYLSHISGLAIGAVVMILLLKVGFAEPNEYERTVIDVWRDRSRSGSGKSAGRSSSSAPDKRPGAPLQAVQRLHVRLPNGQVKFLPVSEFERHEAQGKPVNQFAVSEDGQTWTTFGQWREKRR